MPSPTSPSAIAAIEWADGGINRDNAATDAVIGDAVTGYIGARRSLAGLEPRRSAPKQEAQAEAANRERRRSLRISPTPPPA